MQHPGGRFVARRRILVDVVTSLCIAAQPRNLPRADEVSIERLRGFVSGSSEDWHGSGGILLPRSKPRASRLRPPPEAVGGLTPMMTSNKRPRSPSSELVACNRTRKTWAMECMSFDGVEQSVEVPAPTEPVGGVDGLTISAWVKRSRCNSGRGDRLIDFGNGAEKENIVLNFEDNNMNYETHHAPFEKLDGSQSE